MAVTTFELKVRKSGGISNGSQQTATKRREEERETGRGRGREGEMRGEGEEGRRRGRKEKWKGGREERRERGTEGERNGARILSELGQGWIFKECEHAQTEVEANKLNI